MKNERAAQHLELRFFFLLIAAVLLLCSPPLFGAETRTPPVTGGTIDLSGADISSDTLRPLEGEWLFFHRRFVEPETVPALFEQEDGSGAVLMPVPGFWHQERRVFPNEGYGTYAVRIALPPETGQLALYVEGVHSSYTLYANGRDILRCGVPGFTRESYTAKINPEFTVFTAEESELYLVFHVADFRAGRGGMMHAPILGSVTAVTSRHSRELGINLFFAGAVLIMALYYLGIHFFRRRDYTALFFSFFCFFIALHGSLTGARFMMDILPGYSYEVFTSFEFISAYLLALCFYLYYRHRYPGEVWRPFTYFTYGMIAFFILSAAVMPVRYHLPLFIIFEVYVVIESLFIIGGVILAIRRSRPEAKAFLLGFVILFAAIVQDILYFNLLTVSTGFMLEYGFFAFILIHSFTLARRYTRLERQAKRYAATLEDQNTLLEKQNEEKTRQLEYTRHTLKSTRRKDFLTGLPNSLALEKRLEEQQQERSHPGSSAAPYGVISLVPDGIIELERTEGRSQRDILLLQIATVLEDQSARTGAVFRGDEYEFVVLVPEASSEELHRYIDRVRRELAQSSVTISAGGALRTEGGSKAEKPQRSASAPSAALLLAQAREAREQALSSEAGGFICTTVVNGASGE